MINVLIRNKDTGKVWVEYSTLKRESDVLDHYRQHKIYPDMHEQLRAGARFEIIVLARPATLKVAELLHTKYKALYESATETAVL
jgi:hypothetical protein